MEIPPISITSSTIDSNTIKDAVQAHLGTKCIKDIDSVYISDTLMTHFITFKKVELTSDMKTFLKELGGCVPIKYKHHTFIAISNMYDI
jgi:hypothetical protein